MLASCSLPPLAAASNELHSKFNQAAVPQSQVSPHGSRTPTYLQAAPSPNATAPTGVLRLGLSSSGRDGYLFVPPSYRPATKNALMVVLHGAGKGGLDGLGVVLDQGNSSGARGWVLRCRRLAAAARCRDRQIKQPWPGQRLGDST